ncbi:DUF2637 domain-containing protein [Pseudonocardia parietis]|uniref:DUF2637 domain-containing protein n=1 Tax=Pseudonocardia parietis TaxID=570936 RepID=A0ABS4W3B7_9PSEU|nr:DUF2637 domain-containing protein [Pseudonocardia parietis]MBP2370679.1 hypothetical protein [Pseudonocardia parietis]
MSATNTTRRTPLVLWATWAGMAVVLVAAAVLSFDALRGLALAVRIPGHFAWLLPIAVDAGAAVSCAVWLSPRVARDAARFAAGMTWVLLASTVAGNAGQLAMHAHSVVPPWWVAVLVGAVPPAIVGGTVHLAVLVGRAPQETAGPPVDADPIVIRHLDEVDEVDLPPDWWVDALDADEQEQLAADPAADPAAELIAAGAGRRRLSRELGITEHAARELLATRRNGHPQEVPA